MSKLAVEALTRFSSMGDGYKSLTKGNNKMSLLLRKEINNPCVKGNGYIYEVHHDMDGVYFLINDAECDKELIDDIDKGILDVYEVYKYAKCPYCSQKLREPEDYLGGIVEESPENALECYVSNYCD